MQVELFWALALTEALFKTNYSTISYAKLCGSHLMWCLLLFLALMWSCDDFIYLGKSFACFYFTIYAIAESVVIYHRSSSTANIFRMCKETLEQVRLEHDQLVTSLIMMQSGTWKPRKVLRGRRRTICHVSFTGYTWRLDRYQNFTIKKLCLPWELCRTFNFCIIVIESRIVCSFILFPSSKWIMHIWRCSSQNEMSVFD